MVVCFKSRNKVAKTDGYTTTCRVMQYNLCDRSFKQPTNKFKFNKLNQITVIIVAFCKNATIKYSSESVCVSEFLCFHVSVFLRDNSKSIRSMNTNFNTS